MGLAGKYIKIRQYHNNSIINVCVSFKYFLLTKTMARFYCHEMQSLYYYHIIIISSIYIVLRGQKKFGDKLSPRYSTVRNRVEIFNYYYRSALAVSYDCEDSRSFKFICLKFNSAHPLSRPITCCNARRSLILSRSHV